MTIPFMDFITPFILSFSNEEDLKDQCNYEWNALIFSWNFWMVDNISRDMTVWALNSGTWSEVDNEGPKQYQERFNAE